MISRKPYLMRAMVDWCEDNGLTPLLAVNAEQAGVQVPVTHVEAGRITLNVSSSAMREREISNEAVTGYARFSGRSEYLVLPMPAIEALVVRESGEGMVFPDDQQGLPDAAADGADERASSAGLHVVSSAQDADAGMEATEASSEADDETADEAPAEAPRPPRGKPNLKLIK